MRLHFPRQAGICNSDNAFYRCAKGVYTGCCSTNPCDTGVCGDDSDSNPTTANISNNPSLTDSATLSTTSASLSSTASRTTSAVTSTGSTTAASTSAASKSTTSTLSATSAAPTAPSPSTSQPSDTTRPPVGAIIGGVLGGLALLALLAALLWCCLQRKSKLRVTIGRGKRKVDEERDEELLEAEAVVLEREKFLDAARQKAEREVKGADPFAEFGGHHSENNITGRPGHRCYQQQDQPSSSTSKNLQTCKPVPTITTTPAPVPTPLTVQKNSMPLSSISEKGNVDNIPILDGTEITSSGISVDTNQAGLGQQAGGPSGTALSRTGAQGDPLVPPMAGRVSGSTRTTRTQSTEFSSISSNTNSCANTPSPVSPSPPRDFAAADGVVMRSNLNGSWTRRPRQGSTRKHVMSFMEYDTENESLCSSRRSSLKAAGKALLTGDQGRGLDHQDISRRR